MINLLIMILMAMSNGTTCELGTPIDYYAWVDAHPDYRVTHEFNLHGYKPVWLMKADNDPAYYVFEFAKEEALTGGSNQHGDCFQDVGQLPLD